MMNLLTRLRDYVKHLFTYDPKLSLVSNPLPDPAATSSKEACVVPSTPDKQSPMPEQAPMPEQPPVSEQQSAETQPQPVSPKKYVTEKEFLSESFKKLTPEYLFIITEMRNLLNSERKKFVFHALATHISSRKVAKHLNISQRKVKIIFQDALTDIGIQTGFVRKYLDEGVEKEEEIRVLKSKIISLNTRIEKLESELALRIKFSGEKISIEDQRHLLDKLLTVPFELDRRTVNALRGNDIETLEDLMKYVIEHKGLDKLKTLHNMGEVSFKRLESELLKKGILDIDGNCELLRYVTVTGK